MPPSDELPDLDPLLLLSDSQREIVQRAAVEPAHGPQFTMGRRNGMMAPVEAVQINFFEANNTALDTEIEFEEPAPVHMPDLEDLSAIWSGVEAETGEDVLPQAAPPPSPAGGLEHLFMTSDALDALATLDAPNYLRPQTVQNWGPGSGQTQNIRLRPNSEYMVTPRMSSSSQGEIVGRRTASGRFESVPRPPPPIQVSPTPVQRPQVPQTPSYHSAAPRLTLIQHLLNDD